MLRSFTERFELYFLSFCNEFIHLFFHVNQETKAKLVQITQKLKEAKEEGVQIRADCQAMIKQYQVKFFIFDRYVSPGYTMYLLT